MDVKETKMKTQDIRNMGQALQQVQESAKAALAKKLAKASASSEKGKAAVTLPKAPFDIPKKDTKDEGYGSMVSPETRARVKADVAANMAKIKAKGGQAAVDKSTDITKVKGYTGPKKVKSEALKGDQHKLDHDDDGDIDAADFAKLRKKKKGEKSEVKPRQETDADKGQATAEKTEATRWPVYARIMEKATHKGGGTPPEEMDSKDSPSAKKMKADHKADVKDNPEASGDDVKKAADSAPAMKARGNDNMKGDKAIVNPVKGAVTK